MVKEKERVRRFVQDYCFQVRCAGRGIDYNKPKSWDLVVGKNVLAGKE